MNRDYHLFLQDIVDAIDAITDFLGNMRYEEFLEDGKTHSAIVWKIQVIGEATKNVPRTIRQRYPAVPWKEMAGMRDRIAHSYFGIDYEIVWNVIKDRLPEIKPQIQSILNDLSRTRLL